MPKLLVQVSGTVSVDMNDIVDAVLQKDPDKSLADLLMALVYDAAHNNGLPPATFARRVGGRIATGSGKHHDDLRTFVRELSATLDQI